MQKRANELVAGDVIMYDGAAQEIEAVQHAFIDGRDATEIFFINGGVTDYAASSRITVILEGTDVLRGMLSF